MRHVQWNGYWLGMLLMCGLLPFYLQGGERRLQGAWKIEGYTLKDGAQPMTRGTIVFGEHDWVVLFFVVDADGRPLRASGEGGTYVLAEDRLTFTHRYLMFSGGAPVEGLPESPPQMKLDSGVEEECRIEQSGDELTVLFPSGNRMRLRRSS